MLALTLFLAISRPFCLHKPLAGYRHESQTSKVHANAIGFKQKNVVGRLCETSSAMQEIVKRGSAPSWKRRASGVSPSHTPNLNQGKASIVLFILSPVRKSPASVPLVTGRKSEKKKRRKRKGKGREGREGEENETSQHCNPPASSTSPI